MDAIRKKMKSLKDETDQLYAIIQVKIDKLLSITFYTLETFLTFLIKNLSVYHYSS